MFNSKKNLIKLTLGIGFSAAMLLTSNGANEAAFTPSVTVKAASSFKVRLKHNAFVYNYAGKRLRKASLKKGKSLKVYRTKTIHGKKYLYIGKHQYIKSANATKYNLQNNNYLFSIKVNPGSTLYVTPNGEESNWSMENTQHVYAVTKDSNGMTWYKLGKNNWIKSTDTNKPVSNSGQNTTIPQKSNATPSNQSESNNNTKTASEKNSSESKVVKNTSSSNKNSQTTVTNVQNRATAEMASEIEKSFITQLNETRQKLGKQPLSLDSTLNDFAHTRANELIVKFSHERPNGQSFNYGECISMDMIDVNTTASKAAKKVLDRFLYDDAASNWGHRDSLLSNDFDKIGVGVAWETKPGTSWNNYRFPEYMGFRMAVDLK